MEFKRYVTLYKLFRRHQCGFPRVRELVETPTLPPTATTRTTRFSFVVLCCKVSPCNVLTVFRSSFVQSRVNFPFPHTVRWSLPPPSGWKDTSSRCTEIFAFFFFFFFCPLTSVLREVCECPLPRRFLQKAETHSSRSTQHGVRQENRTRKAVPLHHEGARSQNHESF